MSEYVVKGQGTSPGIVIGEILRLPTRPSIPHTKISEQQCTAEVGRLIRSLRKTASDWEKILQRLSAFYAHEQHRIIDSYLALLRDRSFQNRIEQHIRENLINAEWALEEAVHHYHILLPENREDFDAIFNKMTDHLRPSQEESITRLFGMENRIIVAEQLSPAMIASLPRNCSLGFVTTAGSATSHTLILARSLKIPGICGVEGILSDIPNGEKAVLNGFEGELIIRPSSRNLESFRSLGRKHQMLEKLLLKEASLPAATLDNIPIRLEANVELLDEVPSARSQGAEGIGLFRSEGLFWNPAEPPSEEKQYACYTKLLREMKGAPVTIRTLDISGEEWLQSEGLQPALGLRGIRFGLKEHDLLYKQLRAILRASRTGPIKILLPMVSMVEEVETVREWIQKIRNELNIEKVPVGVMIEVPAAFFIMDHLSEVTDFFAIGTNDLIQYTLAADRTNEHVAGMITPFHPAILRILKASIEKAKEAQKPIYLCGELGGDPLFLPVLIGMGLTRFSMNPQSIPRAKKIIRSISRDKYQKETTALLACRRTDTLEKRIRSLGLALDTHQ